MKREEVSLYFHIPFCSRKCPYCHFYTISDDHLHRTLLMEALRLEWQKKKPLLEKKKVVSIYFGGGTPTLMGSDSIGEILSWIPYQKAEITIEGNPEGITFEQLRSLASVGINRISYGVQSLDDELLRLLGRHHSAKQAVAAVEMTVAAGVENITIDLMYEVPTQTLPIWKQSVDQAIQLPITHLSLYNLIFEPKTPFFRKRAHLQPQVPEEETSLAMYRYAQERFAKAGMQQYEISAFAKEGYRSLHNCGYWQARPFLGLGPSAFSYWEGKRFQNIPSLKVYSRHLNEGLSPVDYEEELDHEAQAKELLAVELRLLDGVEMKKHQKLPLETHLAIEKLVEYGLLEKRGSRLAMTQKGIPLYDTIATEII